MITPKHVVKKKRKERLRKSIRKRINGTPEKPRMIIVRSNKYLYTQVIDDLNGVIMASASTLEADVRAKLKYGKNNDAAKVVGEMIADRLKEIKIDTVVFDRNIYPFTGRIKTFADTAREKGIKF